MNSFNLTLSGKHFICPSILNDSFAGYSNLGYRSLPFMTWNTSFQPLLAWNDSFEKSAESLMGTPLQVTLFFPLATFKILSFIINLGKLSDDVPWCDPPWIQFLWECLGFLDFLEVYFLYQIEEVFLHYFFKIIFWFLTLPILCLAPLWFRCWSA